MFLTHILNNLPAVLPYVAMALHAVFWLIVLVVAWRALLAFESIAESFRRIANKP